MALLAALGDEVAGRALLNGHPCRELVGGESTDRPPPAWLTFDAVRNRQICCFGPQEAARGRAGVARKASVDGASWSLLEGPPRHYDDRAGSRRRAIELDPAALLLVLMTEHQPDEGRFSQSIRNSRTSTTRPRGFSTTPLKLGRFASLPTTRPWAARRLPASE